MNFFDALFQLIFGRRRSESPPSAPPPPPRPQSPPAAPPPPPPPAAPTPPPPVQDYLASLRAQDPSPLTQADFDAAARDLGCERAAIQAVVEVESGRFGAFGPDGRPIILFEPHQFSRRTGRRFDASHPNISYQPWDPNRYPGSQDARWAQLTEAYGLDENAAIASASWGLFQIMGFNHNACGFPDPKSFVSDMSRSQPRQLQAFISFIRTNNLVGPLVDKNWEAFAAGYNGSGQVEYYAGRMRSAYQRLTGSTS